MSISNKLFSKEWCEAFRLLWNEQTLNNLRLKKTGPIKFVLLDGDHPKESCLLEWDKTGILNIVADKKDDCPEFLAPEIAWNEFIEGKQTAVASVMSGRIRYIGSMELIVNHSRNFEDIPIIARSIKI